MAQRGENMLQRTKESLVVHPATASKPSHRNVFERTSCFPGEVILFEAVSESLGLSQKL